MKDFLHRSASLFLAFLVLGSTMSFSVAKHYCGDHLVDVAFFGDAEPCTMEAALAAKYGDGHTKKMDCCSDERVVLEGQDVFKLQLKSFTLENVVFLQAFSYSYSYIFQGTEEQFVPFHGYPPPLITSNFQLLYEQHLI